MSNDRYTPPASLPSQSYAANGLGQYTAVNGTPYRYDTRGNLTSDGRFLSPDLGC